jgi:peptidoglycan hydrolase-like protein with peptidoglycan-binding domain
MTLRPTEGVSEQPDGTLESSLPLESGASGPAVAELQRLLLASGIWVGPSGADGSFGPDTARAVALIPPGSGRTDRGDPGADGVATAEALDRLRSLTIPPVVDGDSACPSVEELVQATAEMVTDIFRLFEIRCSSGWATAYMTEYSFTDGTQLFFAVDQTDARLVGGAYGPENGCASYGVPVEAWSFFGC